MDPVTAFGLACNVLQVVDMGLQVTSTLRKAYKEGTASRDGLHQATARFCEASDALGTAIRDSTTHTALDQDDQALYDLTIKSQATARRLLTELNKLNVTPGRTMKAIIVTIKSIWRSSAIKDVEGQMRSYQKAIDSEILLSLRKRYDLVQIQQQEGFSSINSAIQRLVVTTEKKYAAIAQVIATQHTTTRSQITQEGSAVQGHITKKMQELKIDLFDSKQYDQVLRSLFFPEMNSRQEEIHPAFEKTFQWIFSSSQEAVGRWDNFLLWLETREGIYWINGKAGSGKSTLLSYICDDSRTTEALAVWAGHGKLHQATFFFWRAGTVLQKSAVGLLRKLVYEIVKACPETLSGIVTPDEFTSRTSVWTEKRLRDTLRKTLIQASPSSYFCLFIDGLDEFEGETEELVELLHDITRYPRVKICVSSRPERAFEVSFDSSKKLKLQELTYDDIRDYVTGKLERVVLSSRPKKIDKLIDVVLDRADGVFLWVRFAVKLLTDGLRDEENYHDLREALEALPYEFKDLYRHMIGKIKDRHRYQAAQLFSLVMGPERPISITTLALVNFGDDTLQKHKSRTLLKSHDIVERCRLMRIRIDTRCGGILETRHARYYEDLHDFLEDQGCEASDLGPSDSLRYYEECEVQFIHRTAFDFFREEPDIVVSVGARANTTWNAFQALGEVQIERVRQFFPDMQDIWISCRRLWMAFEYFMWAERENASPSTHLLQELEAIGTMLLQHIWCSDEGMRSIWSMLAPRRSCYRFSKENPGDSIWNHGFGVALDFLGVCAEHGLDGYVTERLEDMKLSLRPEQLSSRASYLLSCAIQRKGIPDHSFNWAPTAPYMSLPQYIQHKLNAECARYDPSSSIHDRRLPIIEQLISCGADPNHKGTGFVHFREQDPEEYQVSHLVETGILHSVWYTILEAIADGIYGGIGIAKALVIHGANINESLERRVECFSTERIKYTDMDTKNFDEETDRPYRTPTFLLYNIEIYKIQYIRRLSALAIAQTASLGHGVELSKLLQARGAVCQKKIISVCVQHSYGEFLFDVIDADDLDQYTWTHEQGDLTLDKETPSRFPEWFAAILRILDRGGGREQFEELEMKHKRKELMSENEDIMSGEESRSDEASISDEEDSVGDEDGVGDEESAG